MHWCLTIAEVQATIFEIYDTPFLPDREKHRPTLYAAALTCKILHESALSVLWKYQDSLLPLLKTFPQDSWVETPTLSFIRRLETSDWSRFHAYARRIQFLSFSITTDFERLKRGIDEYDAAVFRILELSADIAQCPRPFLVNLRSLTYHETRQQSLWNASLFLGHKLTNLRIIMLLPSPSLESQFILTAVKVKCPYLQDLRVLPFTTSDNLTSVMLDLICNLRHLRSLYCACVPISLEAVVHLASLPNLRTLDMVLSNDDIKSWVLPQDAFPALRDISISVDKLEMTIDFITLLPRPLIFNRVHVSVCDPPSSHDHYRFFSTLVEHCSPAALIDVGVTFDGPQNITPHHPLEVHTLKPLFPCPNLQNVDISTPLTYEHVNNALLESIASAWPQLRSLHIFGDYQGSLHASANLQGLLHLARCSKLEEVMLPFIASIPDTMVSHQIPGSGSGVCHEAMTTLWLGHSPITNPTAVATFLSDHFPNLSQIEAWQDDEDNEDEAPEHAEIVKLWEEAKELYTSFVSRRKQESVGARKSQHTTLSGNRHTS